MPRETRSRGGLPFARFDGLAAGRESTSLGFRKMSESATQTDVALASNGSFEGSSDTGTQTSDPDQELEGIGWRHYHPHRVRLHQFRQPAWPPAAASRRSLEREQAPALQIGHWRWAKRHRHDRQGDISMRRQSGPGQSHLIVYRDALYV